MIFKGLGVWSVGLQDVPGSGCRCIHMEVSENRGP